MSLPEKTELGPPKPPMTPRIGCQYVNVCVPVTVTPYTVHGMIRTQCCGEAVVTSNCDHCKGRANGSCDFTITQKICVEVPIDFGANVALGDSFIECAGARDVPCNCADNDDPPCEFNDLTDFGGFADFDNFDNPFPT